MGADIQKTKNYAEISKSRCFKSKEKENFRSYQRLLWRQEECLDRCQEHLGERFDIRLP